MTTVEQKLLRAIQTRGTIINRISDNEYEAILDGQSEDVYVVTDKTVKRKQVS